MLVLGRNRAETTFSGFNGAAFFQSGKCVGNQRVLTPGQPRFNGAAFFQSGKYGCSPVRRTTVPVASMEPLFFKAENRASRCLTCCGPPASMEPLFFKAENRIKTNQRAAALKRLQWSRFFSKRKMRGYQTNRCSRVTGFNGAAFFQSGKCQLHA